MYVLSNSLISEINSAIQRVKNSFSNLEFDEYIALPDFSGNIILRFEYTGKDAVTLETLDTIETGLREIVGADFMANLMGEVSRQCGVDFSQLNETLIRIDANESVSIRACKAHCEALASDCATIRRVFDIPDRYPIWEIQNNPEGLMVLALHPANEQPPFTDRENEIDNHSVRVHFLPDDYSFRGLMKTASIAQENGMSITHVLLNAQKSPVPH